MENVNKNLTFKSLIYSDYIIKIPSYQRAYAWEEKQIKQFMSDLIEIGSKTYYYGHFIIEENEENKFYEVIDGQQRITTFILFIIAAKLYFNLEVNDERTNLIRKRFYPIDYDSKRFNDLLESIFNENKQIDIYSCDTSSLKRIVKAMEYFSAFFKENESKIDFEKMIISLENASVSIHITNDKSVAVQIFELQNSRGIGLDLIEKVKAKLMKELYINCQNVNVEQNIKIVQDCFSDIYELEEKTVDSSFRGEFSLNHILQHHLRVIDDGTKILEKDLSAPVFGNLEENVLKYVGDKLLNLSSEDKVRYVLNLSLLFKKSVAFLCSELIELDKVNSLIGDAIILDRSNSIELFLTLYHNGAFEELDLKKWELLLFTRDFHIKYYNKKGKRDNFQALLKRVLKKEENINTILDNYLEFGFRGHNDGYKLQEIFAKYIIDYEQNFIRNAFNFHPWKEKTTYLLYKFEIDQSEEIRGKLREIFKNKKTLDHILPQNWNSNWVVNEQSDDKIKFQNDINAIINGLGNLMIVSHSENSSLSDKAPFEKEYQLKEFGSYKKHFESKSVWRDSGNWEIIINNRGQLIYDFLKEYFKVTVSGI